MHHTSSRVARSLATFPLFFACLQTFVSCGGDEFDSCEAHRSCPPTHTGGVASGGLGGAGGSSGFSSGGATAGNSSLGGVSGNANANAGEGGSDGGENAGGAGGAPACDGACHGETPVCDVASQSCVACLRAEHCSTEAPVCDSVSHTCVECTTKSDCGGETPACDVLTHACVGCLARADCKAPTPACDTATNTCVACTAQSDCKGATPRCDLATNTCVACLEQADCGDPTASLCDSESHTCKPCSENADCSSIAGKSVCEAGVCVQCSSKDFAACGGSGGTPYVCDSKLHTCTARKQRSAGLCGACVSDKECALGQLCVLDTVSSGLSSKQVGYFCHWRQGDTANGAPSDCPTQGRPYIQVASDSRSIDGETADVCTLAVSSCTANAEFRNKSCAPTGTPNDSLCGAAAPNDAKCVTFGSSYRCTMTCLSNDDCPAGSSCNTAVTPRVCTL